MVTRSGSFLVSSLAVHGVLFAALASSPPPVEPAPALRVIEFVTITDEGGGRIGNDEQIGDAVALAGVGLDDTIVPVDAALELGRMIPGCRIIELAGEGHFWVINAADEVLGRVAQMARN